MRNTLSSCRSSFPSLFISRLLKMLWMSSESCGIRVMYKTKTGAFHPQHDHSSFILHRLKFGGFCSSLQFQQRIKEHACAHMPSIQLQFRHCSRRSLDF